MGLVGVHPHSALAERARNRLVRIFSGETHRNAGIGRRQQIVFGLMIEQVDGADIGIHGLFHLGYEDAHGSGKPTLAGHLLYDLA